MSILVVHFALIIERGIVCALSILVVYSALIIERGFSWQVCAFVERGAGAFETADNLAYRLGHGFQDLNNKMHMVGHHFYRQHLDGNTLRRIERGQVMQGAVNLCAEVIKGDICLLRTVACQLAEQMETLRHNDGDMINAATFVIPVAFVVVTRHVGVVSPPLFSILQFGFIFPVHIPFCCGCFFGCSLRAHYRARCIGGSILPVNRRGKSKSR